MKKPFELILGNCMDALPGIIPRIDACITDPPYGIGWKGHYASTLKWKEMTGDDGSLDLRPILNLECFVACFGANNFPSLLPHAGRWMCWDKRVNPNADRMMGSPFELIWTNRTKGNSKFFRIMHGGAINADGHGVRRVHPTQKPIKLMEEIIDQFTKPGDTVLDPFMGSGTTGVACVRTGRNFIGIEIDPDFYKIASERILSEFAN